MKTICIIGCGGFVGSHLLNRLLSSNRYRIYGFDISTRRIQSWLKHKNFIYRRADIWELAKMRAAIRKSDCVILLTALCNPALYNSIPLKVVEVNFQANLKIVELCSQLKKWVIVFSTSEVYGKTLSFFLNGKTRARAFHYRLKEDRTPLIMGPVHMQRWIYACAKQLLERMVYAYGFEKGLDFTIVRPFNFIGPEMDFIPGITGEGIPRVLACFLGALLRNQPLPLVNGGRSKRTFTYIGDAVEAICLMIENPKKAKGEIFNIGNPKNEVTIRRLALITRKIFQQCRESGRSAVPLKNVAAEKFYGKGYEDCDRRMPDISKARRLLGWKPETDLETALRETICYYIDGRHRAANCIQ